MLSAGRDRPSAGWSTDGTLQLGTMRPNLGPAIEDSVKVVDEPSQVDGWGTTNRIAERPTVTLASVTGKVKKLAATRPPLVLFSKHRGAVGGRRACRVGEYPSPPPAGTPQGAGAGYVWPAVHGEADRLEKGVP